MKPVSFIMYASFPDELLGKDRTETTTTNEMLIHDAVNGFMRKYAIEAPTDTGHLWHNVYSPLRKTNQPPLQFKILGMAVETRQNFDLTKTRQFITLQMEASSADRDELTLQDYEFRFHGKVKRSKASGEPLELLFTKLELVHEKLVSYYTIINVTSATS